jgi:hypothetical protein
VIVRNLLCSTSRAIPIYNAARFSKRRIVNIGQRIQGHMVHKTVTLDQIT